MNVSFKRFSYTLSLLALTFTLCTLPPAARAEILGPNDTLPPEVLIDRSNHNITVNGDKVQVESGDEEDEYSDEAIEITEKWEEKTKQFEAETEASQKRIKEENDARCEKNANILNMLFAKGFMLSMPLGNLCAAGGAGTESGNALEEVQKLEGLYPEKTILSKNAPSRYPAGELTDLTVQALELLPNRKPGEQYTRETIEKVKVTIADNQAKEKQKEIQEQQQKIDEAMKFVEENPDVVEKYGGALLVEPTGR